MTGTPDMRSPAPVLANGKDRAEVIRNEFPNTTSRARVWLNGRKRAALRTPTPKSGGVSS